MGQLGMQELIVIFVIALLVFGPRKLPELGKSLGKGLREFRRATNEMKATWDEQLRETENEIRDTTRDLKKVDSELKKDLSTGAPSATASRQSSTAPGPTDSTPDSEQDSEGTAGNSVAPGTREPPREEEPTS